MTTVLDSLAFNWAILFAQVINLVAVILLLWAFYRIWKKGEGIEVPLGIIFSFCIPLAGPIVSLIHFRQGKLSDG